MLIKHLTQFSLIIAITFMSLTALPACTKNADGSYSITARSISNYIAEGLSGKKRTSSESLTLAAFLKSALTPNGLSMNERLRRARSMEGKAVTIILPDNLGRTSGSYSAEYTAQAYIQNSRYYEKNRQDTGNVNISFGEPSIEWNLPVSSFIKYIKSEPDLKLVKIGMGGSKHIYEYYRFESNGYIPAVLYWEPVVVTSGGIPIIRELTLSHSLPTTRKALQKELGVSLE